MYYRFCGFRSLISGGFWTMDQGIKNRFFVIFPIFLGFLFFLICEEGFSQRDARRERRAIRRDRIQQRVEEREKLDAENSSDFPVLTFLREFQGIGVDPSDKPGMKILRELLSPIPSEAGDLRPVYTVSLENPGELDATLSKMAGLSDSEEYYSDFRDDMEQWGGKFVDPDRKAGFVLFTDGRSTVPMIFIPVLPGREAAYEFLATFGEEFEPGKVQIQETAEFRWVYLGENPYVRLPRGTVVVQKGSWGYIVPQSLMFSLPADPRVYLPQIEGKYIISDYFYLEGFPRTLGNFVLNIAELVAKRSKPKNPKFGPEQKEITLALLSYARVFINETQSLFRGVKVDDSTDDVILETVLEVVPGGNLSYYLQQQQMRTAELGSFYQPEGALFAVLVSEESDPAQKRIAHAVVRNLFREVESRMRAEQQLRAEENAALRARPDSGDTEPILQNGEPGEREEEGLEQETVEEKYPLEHPIPKRNDMDLSEMVNAYLELSQEKKEHSPESSEIPNDPISAENVKKSTVEKKGRTESPQRASGSEVKNAGEIAESFASSLNQYFSGAWSNSISTALENTKDQLEIESVHKMEAIVHENIERGSFDGAITVRPGGNTIGAVRIVGGDRISAILSGAQLKINTDRRSAHLRGKVKFNSMQIADYKVSSIILPIKDLRGTENLPKSLREETLYLFLAIREDRFCFSLGLNRKAYDELKPLLEHESAPGRLPMRTLVFSPYEFGKLLEPYAEEMKNPSSPEMVRMLLQGDPDSNLTYDVHYTPTSYYSVLRIPRSLWSVVGKMGKPKTPARRNPRSS